MITRNSALLDGWTSDAISNNDLRARALIRLCQSRYELKDIAAALNCSESLVRSLLAHPFCSLYAGRDPQRHVGDLYARHALRVGHTKPNYRCEDVDTADE